MLQKGTVKKETFQLLTQLMQEPLLADTRLVRGTSLALQLGHRESTDLDLFTTSLPDINSIVSILKDKFNYNPSIIDEKTTIGFIDGIKIDIIHHPYHWLENPEVEDSIRLASLTDIAAMKLHAITNSGQRPKDFVDIAFLSQLFSYNTIKYLTQLKYPIYDPIMFDKAIIYFDDINTEAIQRIKIIDSTLNWNKIKQRIIQMTDSPDMIFEKPPLTIKTEKQKKQIEIYKKLLQSGKRNSFSQKK